MSQESPAFRHGECQIELVRMVYCFFAYHFGILSMEGEFFLERKSLGSLYVNGIPMNDTRDVRDSHLKIGDTCKDPSCALSWIRVGDIWICDRTVATAISLNKLDTKYRYLYGDVIHIDGVPYLCRSLRVGSDIDEDNEWDMALDDVGEDDEIWHWNRAAFFGQERCQRSIRKGVARGGRSPRNWRPISNKFVDNNLGFRPVLEPLARVDKPSAGLVSQTVFACSSCDMVAGQLMDYTNYDLVLQPNTAINGLHNRGDWTMNGSAGLLFVRRDSVVSLYSKGEA